MSKYTNLLSEEIKEKIEIYILQNDLQPGEYLPSERRLSEYFQVNRLTVRAALKSLRNEHRIITRHGKGNAVAMPKIEEDTIDFISFSAGWSEDGYETSSKVISFQITDASLPVARHLEIPAGEQVYELTRIRFLDRMPIALETSCIPQKLCPGLDAYDFSQNSLYDTLRHHYNLELLQHKESISITHLNSRESILLETAENAPAFSIKGVTHGREHIIEYCAKLSSADRYMLVSDTHL